MDVTAGVQSQGKLRNFPCHSPKSAFGDDFEAEVNPLESI